MTPQEINVACAIEVGWEPTPEGHFHPDNPTGQTPPNYHGDANAALGLCDLLVDEGAPCEIGNEMDKRWECVSINVQDQTIHHGSGDTLSAAICECFLRVKGKWKE